MAADKPAQIDRLRKEYAQNGFLVFPDALSKEECDKYIAVIDDLDVRLTHNRRGQPRKNGDMIDVLDGIGKAPAIIDLIDHPTILEAAAATVGYNLHVGVSQIVARPGHVDHTSATEQAGFSWHTDLQEAAVAANGRLPHLATRVGYYLTDFTEPNMGSVSIVPGSHRVAGPPAWDFQGDEPYGSIEFLGTAGTAIMFDNRLWHSPMPNYSAYTRKTIYFEYTLRAFRPTDHHQYPEEMVCQYSDLRKQLLGWDFSEIADGYQGYSEPQDSDTPLKGWLAGRGLDDIPSIAQDAM
jgi:ectoine hydroxylase-related dioxygenase (phytanoyl-CoA dioxygenase family)